MAPCIIGIGGAHSSSGKTEAACAVLRELQGWGAVKCTPTKMYTSLADDPETLATEGKDTARYIEAGASEVLWVQATPEDMHETVEMARDRLSHLPGIVVEGNSAIEVLNPDIVIFIFNEPLRLKPGAERILSRADAVMHPAAWQPDGIPSGASVFAREELGAMARHAAGLIGERCLSR